MNLGMPEVIIIAIVILFLFGGKKLPELMHGVGKGIRDFKRGMNGVEEEIKKDDIKKDDKTEDKKEEIKKEEPKKDDKKDEPQKT